MSEETFEKVSSAADAHVVPLRTSGKGSPLFCFPGSGGNVYIFRDMIAAMPEGSPAYGIDMEWLCDERSDFTVEKIAALYEGSIRQIQKKGPYYFCGYSFGGLVAYEMARRLTNEGEVVDLVALLDAPNPALLSNLPKEGAAQFHRAYLSDRLQRYARSLLSGDLKAFKERGLAFIISRAGRRFMPLIKSLYRISNRSLPAAFRANDPGFLRAWRNYSPKPYPKGVVCFRVQGRGPEHDLDATMGWNACVMGGVQVHIVPGGHVEMMRIPSVCLVAEKVAAYLKRSHLVSGA